MKQLLTITLLLLFAVTADGQTGGKYSVNITGADKLIHDYYYSPGERFPHSFNFENNLGTYYPDDGGVIRIDLPNGSYQYIANRQNGSFYVHNRNVYFEIRYSYSPSVIDTRKIVDEAYDFLCSKKDKKKARELFLVAAEGGNVDGMYAYSRMCYNGMGGRKNKNQALHWMNEALKHGHYYAVSKLDNFNNKKDWEWHVR